MSEIARLGIQIDSSAAQQAAERLSTLTGAGARTEAQLGSLGSKSKRLASDLTQVNAASQKVANALNTVGRAIQGAAFITAARQIIGIVDSYTLMTARLGLVTSGTEQLTRVQNNLFAQAQKNRQGLGETTNLYVSLARSTKDAGVSEGDLLKVTDAVNKSLLISGTSATEAQGALRQLGQAFASGSLRGDEFNSVNEQMPRLMEAVAKGMGRTTGELRAMAAAGELTTNAILPALISQMGKLNEEASKIPLTVGQANTQLQNSFGQLLSNLEKQLGAVARVAEGVSVFSKIVADPGLLLRMIGLDRVSELETSGARLRFDLNKTVAELEVYTKAAGENPNPAQLAHMEKLRANASRLTGELNIATQALKDFSSAGDSAGSNTYREVEGEDIRIKRAAESAAVAKGANAELKKLQESLRSPGDKRNDLVKKIRELGTTSTWSKGEVDKLVAAAKLSNGGAGAANKQTKEAEAAAKRMAALDTKIGGKDLTSDMADIQRALTEVTSTYEGMNSRLESLRQAGLVDDQEYYAERRSYIEGDNRVREAALQQEIQRLNEEKGIAAERRDAAGGTGSEKLEAQKKYAAEVIQLNRQILDNESEIQRARKKTDVTQQNLNTTEQTGAKQKLADNLALRNSAEDYLKSLQKQQNFEVESMGKGGETRDRLAGLAQINEKYQQQLLDNTRERAAAQNNEQRKQLDAQLLIIKEFQEKAVSSYEEYWFRLKEKQRDATVGAREAIANYIDGAENIAKQTEQVVGGAFQGLEDSLVDATKTGKLSFSQMLAEMQADLARMFVKQTVSMLLKMMGGQGSMGNSPADAATATQMGVFAKGGSFPRGINGLSSGVYTSPQLFKFASGMGLMAEAGPEAVMPLKRGSNGKLGVEAQGAGGAGPVTNTFNVNMGGNSGTPSPMEMKRILATAVERAMANKQRRSPGGR